MTYRISKGMISFSRYDPDGVFVVVGEGRNQAPIVMETEGEHSSFEEAQKRAKASHWLRTCVCRLVPVSGNELLALDLHRMQPKEEELPF